MIRTGECTSCGDCCRTVNITAMRDITLKQHGNLEELKRYLAFRGIKVVGEDAENNLLFYSIDIFCSELTPDNQCRVHNSPEKPLLCYRYPREKADLEGIKECGYKFV